VDDGGPGFGQVIMGVDVSAPLRSLITTEGRSRTPSAGAAGT
jgi:hypothetical protein